MAIKFKTEVEKKAEKTAKAPKGKLEKAQKVLFILAIIAMSVLLSYFVVCFARGFIFAALVIFWLFAMLIPTAFTLGIVWASEGYRNFIKGLLDLMGKSGEGIAKAAEILLNSVSYVGPISLLVVAAYGVLSFICYRKDTENKKYFYHFIAACTLFGLGLIFIIVSVWVLKNNFN